MPEGETRVQRADCTGISIYRRRRLSPTWQNSTLQQMGESKTQTETGWSELMIAIRASDRATIELRHLAFNFREPIQDSRQQTRCILELRVYQVCGLIERHPLRVPMDSRSQRRLGDRKRLTREILQALNWVGYRDRERIIIEIALRGNGLLMWSRRKRVSWWLRRKGTAME